MPYFPRACVAFPLTPCTWLIYVLSVTGSHSNDPRSLLLCLWPGLFFSLFSGPSASSREPSTTWAPRPWSRNAAPRAQSGETASCGVRPSMCVSIRCSHVKEIKTAGGRLGPLELGVCLEQGALWVRAGASMPLSPSEFFTASLEGGRMGMSDLVRDREASIQRLVWP